MKRKLSFALMMAIETEVYEIIFSAEAVSFCNEYGNENTPYFLEPTEERLKDVCAAKNWSLIDLLKNSDLDGKYLELFFETKEGRLQFCEITNAYRYIKPYGSVLYSRVIEEIEGGNIPEYGKIKNVIEEYDRRQEEIEEYCNRPYVLEFERLKKLYLEQLHSDEYYLANRTEEAYKKILDEHPDLLKREFLKELNNREYFVFERADDICNEILDVFYDEMTETQKAIFQEAAKEYMESMDYLL